MADKNTAAFGIYSDRTAVETAVDTLKAEGYRNTDISVLFPQTTGTKDFAHEKHTKAPEGAATGAGSGIVVGGALGWLAGIGALAIPGLGPFIAAGPIMAAGRSRRRRRGWRSRRSARRDGHSRIRGETLRRTDQKGRHPSLSPLR